MNRHNITKVYRGSPPVHLHLQRTIGHSGSFDFGETLLMAFRFAVILIIIVFLALSFGAVKTARPYRDEAFVSNPAYNLAVHGYMGTTVFETAVSPERAAEIDAGTQLLPGLVGRPNSTAAMIGKLRGIEKHTYWIMPLHLLAQAGWYKM